MLNSQDLLHKLFLRLPYKIKSEFVAVSNTSDCGGTFRQLRILVERAASVADNQFGRLLHGTRNPNSKERIVNFDRSEKRSGKNVCAAAQRSSTNSKTHTLCKICSETHPLWRCQEFKGNTIEERRKIVKNYNLC